MPAGLPTPPARRATADGLRIAPRHAGQRRRSNGGGGCPHLRQCQATGAMFTYWPADRVRDGELDSGSVVRRRARPGRVGLGTQRSVGARRAAIPASAQAGQSASRTPTRFATEDDPEAIPGFHSVSGALRRTTCSASPTFGIGPRRGRQTELGGPIQETAKPSPGAHASQYGERKIDGRVDGTTFIRMVGAYRGTRRRQTEGACHLVELDARAADATQSPGANADLSDVAA